MPNSFLLPGGTSGSLRNRGASMTPRTSHNPSGTTGFSESLRAQQPAAPLVTQPQQLNTAAPETPQMNLTERMAPEEEVVEPQGQGLERLIEGGGPGAIIGFMAKHADAFPSSGGGGGSISGSTSSAGKDLHNFFKGK